jgi:protein gp37
MGKKTGIQWTETTWNPLIGCSKVSAGCKNCYAEVAASRNMDYYGEVITGKRWNGVVKITSKLADPLRWQKPKMVFVNSMSDLFHESVSNEDIAAIFGVMAASPTHTFQVLTKRAGRMLEWFQWLTDVQATWDVTEVHALYRATQICSLPDDVKQHEIGRAHV